MRPATTQLLLVLPAAALVLLLPLALATPVDPLWIPGIYDDADQDDIVGLVVDDGLAAPPAGRVVEGFVPTTQRIGTPRGALARDELLVDMPAFAPRRIRRAPISRHATRGPQSVNWQKPVDSERAIIILTSPVHIVAKGFDSSPHLQLWLDRINQNR